MRLFIVTLCFVNTTILCEEISVWNHLERPLISEWSIVATFKGGTCAISFLEKTLFMYRHLGTMHSQTIRLASDMLRKAKTPRMLSLCPSCLHSRWLLSQQPFGSCWCLSCTANMQISWPMSENWLFTASLSFMALLFLWPDVV